MSTQTAPGYDDWKAHDEAGESAAADELMQEWWESNTPITEILPAPLLDEILGELLYLWPNRLPRVQARLRAAIDAAWIDHKAAVQASRHDV